MKPIVNNMCKENALQPMQHKKNLLLTLSVALVLTGCSGDAKKTTEIATQGIFSADISDNSTTLTIGSIQHGGSLWGIQQNERRFNWNHVKGEFSALVSVDIDPSGNYAATANERTLALWNASTGEPIQFWDSPGNIKSLKLSNNGDFSLLGLGDRTARYFDVKNGGIKQTFRTNAIVRAVDLDETGKLAVTGDDNSRVILWDTETGEKKHEWTLSNRISTVALSKDGQYVFGSAQLGNAFIWSTNTGKAVLEVDTGALASRKVTISKVKFSEDNSRLLTGGINSKVTLYQLPTGKLLKSWKANAKDSVRPKGASILALSFGKDGKYYAIGSNGLLNTFE